MSKKTPEITNVVNDNGYAAHKLAWFENGEIKTLKVPTLIEMGHRADAVGTPIDTYQVDGQLYFCGASVRTPLQLRNEGYPTSVANRVLVTHALVKAGLINRPIKLGVTLPFRDYFNEKGVIRADRKDSTISNFVGHDRKVIVEGKVDQIVDIREGTCFSEALAAYFDFAFNDNGTMTKGGELVTGHVAVVDIGGSTTDVVSLNVDSSGLMIDQQHSGTERVGVLDAIDALEKLMKERLVAEKVIEDGLDSALPTQVVQTALEKGQIYYQSSTRDMTSEQEQACRGTAERITNYVKTKLANINAYQAIIIVGGGSIVFRQWLQKMLPNAVFLDEFSNARGALKYMQFC
ncbi:plasmid segregation protein ParM domain-containing protein [Pseudomonas sp. NPDC096950]|uniref:plasmid segregation protein ParM domain-containing protein n=1 Tax=Pseudomonas sp. NPDC096950 TaxID=3364485 RepID=UPI00383A9A06